MMMTTTTTLDIEGQRTITSELRAMRNANAIYFPFPVEKDLQKVEELNQEIKDRETEIFLLYWSAQQKGLF